MGCLFQAQAGGDQQIGEQRVARAIAVTRSRTLGPFNGQAAQTNFPEGAVIGEIDETDVGTTGCALIGVIAARDRRPAPIVRSSPDLTMRKRCTLDQALPFGPSIKLVERGNRPVPRRCRNPELSIAAPPGTMIGTDIIGIGLPNRLATGRSEKANPDQDIIAMGAQRVSRTRTVQRQIEEVALKVEIIDRTITQDYRDVGVQAIRQPALLNYDRRT